jgi:hypothetical protein
MRKGRLLRVIHIADLPLALSLEYYYRVDIFQDLTRSDVVLTLGITTNLFLHTSQITQRIYPFIPKITSS